MGTLYGESVPTLFAAVMGGAAILQAPAATLRIGELLRSCPNAMDIKPEQVPNLFGGTMRVEEVTNPFLPSSRSGRGPVDKVALLSHMLEQVLTLLRLLLLLFFCCPFFMLVCTRFCCIPRRTTTRSSSSRRRVRRVWGRLVRRSCNPYRSAQAFCPSSWWTASRSRSWTLASPQCTRRRSRRFSSAATMAPSRRTTTRWCAKGFRLIHRISARTTRSTWLHVESRQPLAPSGGPPQVRPYCLAPVPPGAGRRRRLDGRVEWVRCRGGVLCVFRGRGRQPLSFVQRIILHRVLHARAKLLRLPDLPGLLCSSKWRRPRLRLFGNQRRRRAIVGGIGACAVRARSRARAHPPLPRTQAFFG